MTQDYNSIGCGIGVAIFLLLCLALFLVGAQEKKMLGKLTPEEKRLREENAAKTADEMKWGPVNSAMVCPHCQQKGAVRTKPITQKAGVSGGKATAAVLTAGVSLLATGLSRKQKVTEAHCGVCHSTWHF